MTTERRKDLKTTAKRTTEGGIIPARKKNPAERLAKSADYIYLATYLVSLTAQKKNTHISQMTLEMKKILLYIVFLMCFPLSANSQVSGKKFSLDNGFVNGEHRIAELVT